ncbi:MAG TPA: hypothetical protein VF263_14400 [Longimicrobiaceae bacterium]
MRLLTGAVVLALALFHSVPAGAQRAGRVSIGLGFSLGSYRNGLSLSAKAFVHDDAAVACQSSTFAFTFSMGCSADVYAFGDEDSYVTLGAGRYSMVESEDRRWVNLGFGRDFRTGKLVGTSVAAGPSFATSPKDRLQLGWFLDPALSLNLLRPDGDDDDS